ncbi:MAG TPA: hypothetical protein VLT45_24460 [Kofleriaceae bacterium]|nr:hypothetical protein [Kofleriaceae bacterium]
MKFFVRAVVTGFALSLGSALFKKIAPQLGLDDKKDKDKDKDSEQVNAQDGASDPGLQHRFS